MQLVDGFWIEIQAFACVLARPAEAVTRLENALANEGLRITLEDVSPKDRIKTAKNSFSILAIRRKLKERC